jgi:hypothetical protein
LSISKSAHAEAQAARQRRLDQVLAELGLTHPDHALFITIHYGIHSSRERLPDLAKRKYNADGEDLVTEEECRVALAGCLERGWLQVMTEQALAEITAELRRDGVIGPVYGLPPIGGVDFTRKGAELWLRLQQECQRSVWCVPSRPPFAYSDVVHEKKAQYFQSRRAALESLEYARAEEDVVSVRGPTPTGPWRAQWWRRFPEGYRIDIEERRHWTGCGSAGGESCYLNQGERDRDPQRLRSVLDRHNVTFAEWVLLELMEGGPYRLDDRMPPYLSCGLARQCDGATLTQEEYREARDACLRNGWLRVLNKDTVEEVHSLMHRDPVHLALPRTAELCSEGRTYNEALWPLHGQIAIPSPPGARWGEIDFSPTGAQLYRMIAAEWLGPDWEDDLAVENGYYREIHFYCESREVFDRAAKVDQAWGNVRARRLAPIGPWCVAWWERFPAGYRLELEIGDPDG